MTPKQLRDSANRPWEGDSGGSPSAPAVCPTCRGTGTVGNQESSVPSPAGAGSFTPAPPGGRETGGVLSVGDRFEYNGPHEALRGKTFEVTGFEGNMANITWNDGNAASWSFKAAYCWEGLTRL